MQTSEIISFSANIILSIAVIYLMFFHRAIEYIKKLKKSRETKGKTEKARFVRQVRIEVRRYLEELQDSSK